jgi:hypothetical protein
MLDLDTVGVINKPKSDEFASDSHQVELHKLFNEIKTRLLIVSGLFTQLHNCNSVLARTGNKLERGVDNGAHFWGLMGSCKASLREHLLGTHPDM